jgi:hypothetical protein
MISRSANEATDEKFALLEEHERLNKSLAALSRHFAHVQLRLQQVVSAPTSEDREVNEQNTCQLESRFQLFFVFSGVTS